MTSFHEWAKWTHAKKDLNLIENNNTHIQFMYVLVSF